MVKVSSMKCECGAKIDEWSVSFLKEKFNEEKYF